MSARGALRLAVVEDGALCEARGADVPVPWWSFTKTVLAAASLILVRDGTLTLDTPLPDRPYTLRHLLQHRSGLPDYGELAAYHAAVGAGEEPWPVPVLLERCEARRLRSPPGEGWDYSNLGFLAVRRLVEETAGEGLGVALRHLVLDPLGVPGARLAETPPDLAGVDLGDAVAYHPGWVYHGLLVGTMAEAATLLHRLMTGDLLPPSLMAEMGRAHRVGGPVPGRPWREPGYGLGVMAGTMRRGIEAIGHTGGGPGSVCAIYHGPGRRPQRTVAAFAAGGRAGRAEGASVVWLGGS